MALPVEHLPRLTVIDGGSPLMRVEEAHVEAIAFCDEVVTSAAKIVDTLFGLPVPSAYALNEAMKLAHRAERCKAELRALGPRDAA